MSCFKLSQILIFFNKFAFKSINFMKIRKIKQNWLFFKLEKLQEIIRRKKSQ